MGIAPRSVGLSALERALEVAIRDFELSGLYTRSVHEVPVRLVGIRWAHGCYSPSFGISVPAISIQALLDSGPRVSLTDVLRHELAHALADRHPGLVQTRDFREVFGGSYEDEWSESPLGQGDTRMFVTDYATTSPAEDFAETTMVYARCQGRIGRYRHRPGVHQGLLFVRSLAERLRAKGLAWRR